MDKLTFLNLPVKDLDASVAFFTELGFSFNPQFTDENATCMIISDHSYVMLLTEEYFRGFSKKPVPDTAASAEMILAIGLESREQVDEKTDRALAAGGSAAGDTMDEGFMYSRSFQDPDGHLWEFMWMDPAAVQS